MGLLFGLIGGLNKIADTPPLRGHQGGGTRPRRHTSIPRYDRPPWGTPPYFTAAAPQLIQHSFALGTPKPQKISAQKMSG